MKYSVVLMTEFPAAGQGRKARGRVSSEGSSTARRVCVPAPRTFPGPSASPHLGDGLPLQRGARLPAGNGCEVSLTVPRGWSAESAALQSRAGPGVSSQCNKAREGAVGCLQASVPEIR